MTDPQCGQVYRVRFLDHVDGGDDCIEFVAYGRCYHFGIESITLDNWHYADDHEQDRENVGRYTIARAAILELTPVYAG